MSAKVTAGDVRAALMRRFCDPEWALLFEVRNATGFAASRSADALAMSLWPSRGLELHGMEIKVYRSDWQKERAQPEKAETIAAYCDRWHLVTGPGVIADISEIPPAWGWLEFKDGKLFQRREAAKTEAKVCDRSFLAALLRRVSRADAETIEAEVAKRDAERAAKYQERVDAAVQARMRDRDRILADVEAFEKASGISIRDAWVHSADEVGRAVRAVLASGATAAWSGLHHLAKEMRSSAERVEKALTDSNFPAPEKETLL